MGTAIRPAEVLGRTPQIPIPCILSPSFAIRLLVEGLLGEVKPLRQPPTRTDEVPGQ